MVITVYILIGLMFAVAIMLSPLEDFENPYATSEKTRKKIALMAIFLHPLITASYAVTSYAVTLYRKVVNYHIKKKYDNQNVVLIIQ